MEEELLLRDDWPTTLPGMFGRWSFNSFKNKTTVTRKLIVYTAFILTAGVFVNACKKDLSCEGCNEKINKPPIALAGPDRAITLPRTVCCWMAATPATPMGR